MAIFNFRSTEAYVTDGAGQNYVLPTDLYPTTRNGNTFGWTTAVQGNNRLTATTPRLAGVNNLANINQSIFVTDSGAGAFRVKLAIGQLAADTTEQVVRIIEVDSSQVEQSVLSIVVNGTTTLNGQFIDATGVLRTDPVDWALNNEFLEVTVATGNNLAIMLGDGVTGGRSQLAHFLYESTSTPLPPSGTTFTDDFNRADETPLASPYTTTLGAGVNIVSNELKHLGADAASILDGQDFADNQSASITPAFLRDFAEAGVIVRGDVSGNGYVALYDTRVNAVSINRLDSNTLTTLISGTPSPAITTGDVFKLTATDDLLQLTVNGVVVRSFFDITYTSGKVGVYFEGQDDITADNLVATGLLVLPSITSVDGDNTVTDGQQDVPVIVSGFASDITSMSLRVGADTLALTGLTGTGDNYTIDLPDISAFVADTVGLPFSSPAYQVELLATDGTDTAAIDITLEPKAGWEVVETVSAVDTEGSIFETRTGGAPFDGSQIYYQTAGNTTISATGIIQTDATEFTAFVWDVTSKTWEVVTFSAGVAIPVPSRETFNKVAEYLRTQGYTGTTNEVILEWLASEGFTGQINEAMYKYWTSLNLSGGYNDKNLKWKRG